MIPQEHYQGNRVLLAQPCLETHVVKQSCLRDEGTEVAQVWIGTREGYSSQDHTTTVHKIHYRKWKKKERQPAVLIIFQHTAIELRLVGAQLSHCCLLTTL